MSIKYIAKSLYISYATTYRIISNYIYNDNLLYYDKMTSFLQYRKNVSLCYNYIKKESIQDEKLATVYAELKMFDSDFKCSYSTFNKIVKELGFSYKNIKKKLLSENT